MTAFDLRGMSTRGQGHAADAAGGAGSPAALPAASPVLDIRGLSVSYFAAGGDVRAVRDVDLALGAGEVVGLAGESGCGKSTLAYGAVRLLRPPAVITAGSVRYSGRRVSPGGIELLAASDRELRALRWREIAIVFQSAMNALNPVLRIRDQLLDALDAHLELSHDERQGRIETLIDLVGIPRARLNSYPHELSGGMRQRVMIAMALAVEPEVVIMDEPTTGLDVVVQREILQEIFELKDRLGFSVLFITHDLSLLLEIADRVVIMYAGQLVEVGSTDQIRLRAAHPYTQGLLRSFPRLRGPRQQLLGIPGSPPDLRGGLSGCPFSPRCASATDLCKTVDMRLIAPAQDEPEHVTACPFVSADATPPGDRQARPVNQAPTEPTERSAGVAVLDAVRLGKQYRLGAGRKAAVLSAVHDVSLQTVAPEYDGVRMFADAAPPGARLQHVSGVPRDGSLKVWASTAPDGRTRIVLINKSESATRIVVQRAPGVGGSATLERLSAPSSSATSGVSLHTGAITPTGGAYRITLPAASAALLTAAVPPSVQTPRRRAAASAVPRSRTRL